MANTIKVTQKPIATNVSPDAKLLGIQDNGSGTQALYQMPVYDITIGRAENLASNVGVDDAVPYLFRTTGGSADVGTEKSMQIIGGTIGWNSLCKNGDFTSVANWIASGCSYTVSGGVAEITKSAANPSFIAQSVPADAKEHVWIISAAIKGTNAYIGCLNIGNTRIFSSADAYATDADTFTRCFAVGKPTSAGIYFAIRSPSSGGDAGAKFYAKDAWFIDLTLTFGSTIADYINTLETNEAGAGVAYFRNLGFTAPYYAYNAGQLMSVKTSANVTTGFNQWDEEWENGYIDASGGFVTNTNSIRSKNFCGCVPNTQYYFNRGANINVPNICWYDADEVFIERTNGTNHIHTSPKGARFFKISCYGYGSTYNNDICINISWDGSRNGEYEAYEAHTYPLDSDLELRGIPTLDANNNVKYDGDVYTSDGNVTRKYGIVDLGTLDWHDNGTNNVYAPISGRKSGSQLGKCATLVQVTADTVSSNMPSGTFKLYANSTSIAVALSGITTQNAGTMLSGVYFVYELATPTTETADPYAEHIIVNDFGTEEFVDTRTVPIPVGHNTRYAVDLKAKLEMSPNSPDGDGDYIVRQTNGTNHYVQLTFPADELPAPPTTDGNYVLKCTVASGEASYTWTAEA